MSHSILDLSDGDILTTWGDTGMDSDGDLYMRTSDDTAINMSTGEMHITSHWSNDEDDD